MSMELVSIVMIIAAVITIFGLGFFITVIVLVLQDTALAETGITTLGKLGELLARFRLKATPPKIEDTDPPNSSSAIPH